MFFEYTGHEYLTTKINDMKKAIVILLLGFIAGSGYSQSTLKGIYLGGALSYYQQTNNTSSLCTTGN